MGEVKLSWCSDKEVTACPSDQHPGTAVFYSDAWPLAGVSAHLYTPHLPKVHWQTPL